MTKTKTVRSYRDEIAALQTALRLGGARIPCPSLSRAIALRQTLYRARKAHVERTGDDSLSDLFIQLHGPDGPLGVPIPKIKGPVALCILLHKADFALQSLTGEALEPNALAPLDLDDPLEAEAADLARSLGLEITRR